MKYALLALLNAAPAHGYELKQAYEELFGSVLPPLNAGQIYTTLSRLHRDDLVSDHIVEQDDRPDKRVYRLTDNGQAALREWLAKPAKSSRLKDDFFTKLILARTTGLADPCAMIERQRADYMQMLRHLNTQLIATADNLVATLLIEGAILHLEADLKWLTRCEEEFIDE